jgi:hypothetical protein
LSKGKIIAKPNKGQQFAEKPISAIYMTDGQIFAEV